jgi:hypothetical protein
VIKHFLPLVCVAVALLVPPTASAHDSGPAGTMVVQHVGPYVFTATVTPPTTLPGAVSVQIAPQQSFSGVVVITVWLAPTGEPLPTAHPSRVISAQGSVVTQLPITDPGTYELGLQASGQDGGGETRVPVTVVQQPFTWVPALIPAALGGFVLIVGGAMVVRLRRRMSPRLNELLTSSMTLCALVALVAFVATQLIPANVTLSQSGSPTFIVPPTP